MMHINIHVFKDTRKYYADAETTRPDVIPLWDNRFKEFVREYLPARYEGGFAAVDDMPDGEGFHCKLYRTDDLF